MKWSHESQRTPVLEVVGQVVWVCGHQLVPPGSLKPLFSSLTLALLVTSGQPGLRPGPPQKDSASSSHWKDEGGMHSAGKSSEWSGLVFLCV